MERSWEQISESLLMYQDSCNVYAVIRNGSDHASRLEDAGEDPL